MHVTTKLTITPSTRLTPSDVYFFSNNSNTKLIISQKTARKIKASRNAIEKFLKRRTAVYGVTTGFGKFKEKLISHHQLTELQENLIKSHAAGVGSILSPQLTRAVMLARLNTLLQGFSGVRPKLIQFVVQLLNSGILPVIPTQGSVGASGDLAPLSHAGLVLLGKGKVWYKGKIHSTAKVFKKLGIKPIKLHAKEGLAWINGTAFMTGISCIVVEKAKQITKVADWGCALTLEAIEGMSTPFKEAIHSLRPHPGQKQCAKHIRELIKQSKLVDSNPNRVQDSYTLRCAPQVHGAARDAVDYAYKVIARELNSVTDNPIVFPSGVVLSGGNFHGQPVSLAMDFLRSAIAGIGNISERRTAKLIDSALNEGLPLFLIPPSKGGLHNGLMIPQYTAAALASENKILTHPASVDSIPTSANQEDHVSMGSISARFALRVAKNVEHILAIELLTAAQALEFRDRSKLGIGTKKIYCNIRKLVPPLQRDRILSRDIEALVEGIVRKI
ncbi:histidine ammonia-lyase [Candidatus Pacearchaeota archaeon]|nr:MAG: histidine ammonia-lyase [Candidatus Pacearchaeota archaeon]